jgi:predicted ATPase
MFTQLRIQNFKSWADTGEFRMAPLTGFFGTNSSGKTAILQFLLMLKQTVESSDRNRILHLGGDQYSYVDLGTTYDISHRHKLPEKIKFSFEWTPKLISQSSVGVIADVHQDANDDPTHLKVYALTLKKHNSSIGFDSEIDIDRDQIDINFFKYSFKNKDGRNIAFGIQQQNNTKQNSISYRLLIDGFTQQELRNFPSLSKKSFKNYGLDSREFSGLTLAYEDLFQNTYYLAPLREYPKRTYLWSGERPQNVGDRGELAVAALLASRKTDHKVEVSVAKALKELGLIHSFRVKSIAENRRDYEILVQKSPNSAEVLITDVGFGVSQVLPILVLCYYAPKGATLIFEQPEIHLHPSVQAGLADIFIEVIKTRNIQIIIESHSEHLLRRLQRRMAEEKDGFTNDDAAMYFCKMNDQGDSELVTLDIDDYGNICNYPEGFFGDEMGDLVAMTEATIKRQMNVGA